MKALDAWPWRFSRPITDDAVVQCPECSEWAPLAAWEETDVYCDSCGDHAAMRCPTCLHAFDHVWGPVFAVAEPKNPISGADKL